jgi:hypothetical protein
MSGRVAASNASTYGTEKLLAVTSNSATSILADRLHLLHQSEHLGRHPLRLQDLGGLLANPVEKIPLLANGARLDSSRSCSEERIGSGAPSDQLRFAR